MIKKFNENLNTAVFTTKFVVNDKNDITLVTHDNDGSWQFHSKDEWDNIEKVSMVISLGEIIEIDNTILDIADLPLGGEASRLSVKSKWKITK